MSEKLFASYYMSELCNFKCGYCFIHHPYGYRKVLRNLRKVLKPRPSGQPKHELWRDIEVVIEHFRRTGKRVTIGFTGGEPLIYPHFIDICRRIAAEDSLLIALDTNLSVNVERFMEAVPPSKVEYIYAALHVDVRESLYGTVDRFRDDISSLLAAGYPVAVNYLMHPSLFRRVERDGQYFLEKGIELDLKPFYGMYEGRRYPDSYTSDELALMNRQSSVHHEREELGRRFQGRLCNAGKSLVRIIGNGNVLRCGTDHTVLGNIFTGFTLYETAQPCLLPVCTCFSPDRLFENLDGCPVAAPPGPLTRFKLLRRRFVSFWEQ